METPTGIKQEASIVNHVIVQDDTSNESRLDFNLESPWDRVLALSMDGGGIRGISTLLILRKVMVKVSMKQKEHCSAEDEPGEILPARPCHYFDLMVGTSTGGLIAVMLGRLRMTIDECRDQYIVFAQKVFASPRRLHLLRSAKYDHRKVERAMRETIAKCSTSMSFENFKQDDHSERESRSCLCAVLSTVYGGKNTDDKVEYFRSYDLNRSAGNAFHIGNQNPGPAFGGYTWQVCRATSAAPTYFKEVGIGGRKYMDGGVKANNPSVNAWFEAARISDLAVHGNAFLLSVGTGRASPNKFFDNSIFSFISHKIALLKSGLNELTDTENADELMQWIVDQQIRERKNRDELLYSRLTVPRGELGLQYIPLDEWKTKKSSRTKRTKADSQSKVGSCKLEKAARTNPKQPNNVTTEEKLVSDSQSSENTRYVTFEKIQEATNKYLDGHEVDEQIDAIAQRLVDFAQARKKADLQRWEHFIDPHLRYQKRWKSRAHLNDGQPYWTDSRSAGDQECI